MKLKQVVVMIGLLLMVALLAGCQPITAEGMMSALAGQPVEDASAMVGEQAMATVTARSLRVRAEPSDSAEVVTGIREGEQFPVIGRSSDGLWIQLDIPRAPGGNGWVSANFVTVQGPITDATVSSAPPAATEAAAEEATPAPTEEATEAAPTEAPAEEATPAPTEEAAEAAPTEAPAEEATPAPVEEAAEAAPTEAPAEEAVEAAPTEAPAEEATPAPTEEAAEAAPTEAPAEEAAPAVTPEPGFALVTAEGARLRVRAEPSTDAEIVGWVQPGEIVPVEEVSADGLWVKVGGVADTENPNGGWVSAEFVVVGQ
ncbi:MAG: SH3 domain-containing protein [Caldilinea sp.]|nr:SH3 domain-containing protein [Caldilineaceae bacterium]MCB9125897.1 SH3 domain-containing protein [Caldilineaceae bacterium]MCO5208944.1 SH3 domain-containing protein [Caldilinea sp.]MCW5841006.1 SH3 domain-containing protein [Caldilinea sp.]